MLLIILALLWIVLLTPMIIAKVRERRNDRSIESFRNEHEQLARYEYAVEPAYRLDETPVAPRSQPQSTEGGRRPRLTVVHDDDTYGTLESRRSWEEWSDEYDFDRPTRRDVQPTRRDDVYRGSGNRYARAYQSTPRGVTINVAPAVPRSRSMRVRRRVMATRTVLVAVVLSLVAYVTGESIVTDLAVLAWLAVVGYVALALFAISQGYFSLSSRPRREASLAPVEPLYDRPRSRGRDGVDDDSDRWGGDGPGQSAGGYEYEYEPDDDTSWRRVSHARYAIG